ncbi:MAG: two-component system, cell cycle sensor histidine kinase and response regulator CckA [Pyrinomonadaceae bacterium]|nr:two-component system, cell cycle sensor histidine kinase and response regulator CckA [Pyrinomonadaceae bacterium]
MSTQVEEPAIREGAASGVRSNAPVGKILVVDDEPELRSVLVESLLRQGYEVVGCSSGFKALAELRQHDYDVLLTDLMMPEMDGIALLKAALEIDPHLVGIMVTGQGTIQTAVDAMQTGAFDYVLKPFRMQTLLPVLTRAMNLRHLQLENVQLRETVAIHSLCQTIAFTLDPQTVLSKLADAALQQSDADEVSILLPTNDGTELYVAAVRGEKRERLLGERVPLQQSISSWVARERKPLILNGVVRDERFVALWPRSDIRSAVSVPMEVANRLVGIINLNVTNRLRPFTLGQMKALSILASTAAAALESASLYAQVEQAEKNYRSIFENAVEGIFQSTPDRRFLTVNPALAQILGYDSPQEVIASFTDIGKQLHVDPASQEQLAQILDERGILQGFEFEAYRKNGEKIWLSLNLRLIRDERAMEVSREGTIEDITERKRAEMERLVMFEIIQGISTSADLDALLNLVHQTIRKVVYAENCFVALYDEPSDHLEMQFFVDKYDSSPPPQKLGKSCAAYVFRTGEASLIGKQLFAKLVAAGEVELVGEPSPSWLGIPLNTPAKTVGVLVVQHYEDHSAYTQRDVDLLSSVGSQIAVAIERKRAVEALTNSEAEMRALFAAMTDVIFVLNADGRYLRIAPTDPTFLYEASAQMIGKTLHEVFPKTEADLFLKHIRRALAEGKPHRVEYYLQMAGVQVWFDGNVSPMSGDSVLWIARDITERKRAEGVLRETVRSKEEALAQLDALLSSAPIGFAFYTPDLVYQRINKSLAAINGLSVEQHLGKTLREVLPEMSLDLEPLLQQVMDKGEPILDLEITGEPQPNSTQEHHWLVSFYPVRITGGELLGAAVLVSDITERKQAEVALRESEERYRLLFESNPQPMWVYDVETLAFLAVNKSAVRHYGYSREEFLSMTIADIRPAEDLPFLYESVAQSFDGLDRAGEWRHLKRDGSIIEVEITSHALVFADRRAELILANDITERNRLEAALLSSEAQLRQSQKLEAIGQLAGGVAHDFNNLLTAINGYSSLALRKLGEAHPVSPYLDEIKKAGDRAANLTRQLLAFGRKQMLQPLDLNLNDVVTDMTKMLKRLIGEDIQLVTKLNPELHRIKADPGQIEQVLVNLIVNARDAMPTGGNLTIETANAILDDAYTSKHVDVTPGQFIMLAVSDTGTGMDAQTRTRIFEPFFTTKEKGKGTGLGLSTVYGIVKQSGGNVLVYSEEGRGTSFKVYLPQLVDGGKQITIPVVEPVRVGGSETVLVVEDEDMVRKLSCELLQESGYRVLTASGGEEAIQIFKKHKKIDLLITDVIMPKMSGKEVAEQLKKIHPNTKVLFMSGYTDEAIVHHGIVDSHIAFIQKPFSENALAQKVRDVLDAENGHK